jgi:hypothetical protein
VSDEFTVPLCALHHRENHTTGDERRWWQERGLDPLKVADELWTKSRQRLSAGESPASREGVADKQPGSLMSIEPSSAAGQD